METQKLTLRCLQGTGNPRFALPIILSCSQGSPRKKLHPALCDLLWCGAAEHTSKERSPWGKQGSEGNKANVALLRADSPKSGPKRGINGSIHGTKLPGKRWQKPGMGGSSGTKQLSVNASLWTGIELNIQFGQHTGSKLCSSLLWLGVCRNRLKIRVNFSQELLAKLPSLPG